MNDLLKRKGTFVITRYAIEDGPEEVIEALKSVLIVQLENDFITNSIKYGGYSKYFDVIEEYESVPNYAVTCTKDKGGSIRVKWHREKEYTERDVKTILEEIKDSVDIEKIVNALVTELNSASLKIGG